MICIVSVEGKGFTFFILSRDRLCVFLYFEICFLSEPYHCTGNFEVDYTELCRRAGMTEIPPIVTRSKAPGPAPHVVAQDTKPVSLLLLLFIFSPEIISGRIFFSWRHFVKPTIFEWNIKLLQKPSKKYENNIWILRILERNLYTYIKAQ